VERVEALVREASATLEEMTLHGRWQRVAAFSWATLIADALLSDKITDGQRIRLDAGGDQIQFRQ